MTTTVKEARERVEEAIGGYGREPGLMTNVRNADLRLILSAYDRMRELGAHALTCSAMSYTPVGSSGCSCKGGRRLKGLEARERVLSDVVAELIAACEAVDQAAGHRIIDPHTLRHARTALNEEGGDG